MNQLPPMTREQVIERCERKENPYPNWHLDYPDLWQGYYNRLTPEQRSTVDFFNSMTKKDFERFKSIYRAA